jgi:hypothetical protein
MKKERARKLRPSLTDSDAFILYRFYLDNCRVRRTQKLEMLYTWTSVQHSIELVQGRNCNSQNKVYPYLA